MNLFVSNLFFWNEVKHKKHDASGIFDPQDWMWWRQHGIFYPKFKIIK